MEDIAGKGIHAFVTDVVQRGGRATPLDGSNRAVKVWGVDGKSRVVRLRCTARGGWMARRQDGTPGSDDTGSSHWVFVDLAKSDPQFYIVESDEVEAGIESDVELWLAERPGRTRTGSHPVPMSSVAHGHDRWDLLSLNSTKDMTRRTAARPAARTRPKATSRVTAEPEVVDPRTAVVADFGGYRMQGRFDLATRALEITRGPMEGRRFPDPTTAANAVASFLSGDVEKCDGDTFWRVDGTKATSLGKYVARSR